MDYIKICDSKLNVEEVTDLVSSSSCGAISVFIGTTRETFENKKVLQLQYEAYIPMAEKVLKQICEDIRQKWKVENIAIYHRLGTVPVKEASIVIATSSPHRAASLEATHFAIDAVKAKVPIWKKEIYASDEPQWKENTECAWKKS
ncbi:molybdopterin synthase catalytic subunit-like isoform X1 [Schistocerca cancellata]|uniref:molybdopterin synthase catalytic subunit-like isoform X1 n=1 Tax=Schistocerca cancellata TaxID=274614 RepID=UPI002117444E|nr:molybdopterin synthase catalytic subunit-like isoform X1 [Schistocerca cancellata]